MSEDYQPYDPEPDLAGVPERLRELASLVALYATRKEKARIEGEPDGAETEQMLLSIRDMNAELLAGFGRLRTHIHDLRQIAPEERSLVDSARVNGAALVRDLTAIRAALDSESRAAIRVRLESALPYAHRLQRLADRTPPVDWAKRGETPDSPRMRSFMATGAAMVAAAGQAQQQVLNVPCYCNTARSDFHLGQQGHERGTGPLCSASSTAPWWAPDGVTS